MAQIEVIQPPSCVCETCKKFVHLHLHTTYSLLDGAQQIGDLENPKKEMGVLNVVKNLGMDAVAITDHGNMFGVLDFYKKAKKGGLKPILGCEVYIAPGDRRDKSVKDEQKSSYHLLLLAKDLEGYRNLCRLTWIGHFEGFYYKPRIDKEVLRKYSKGLIGTSACLSGEISQQLIRNRHDEARRLAKEYQEIFNGDFYIELQMTGVKQQHEVNPHLAAIAKDLQLPLVATNDVHYMTQEDAKAQDVLMAIQMKKLFKDPDRMKHEVDEFYVKSPEAMWELFKDYPEACENTVKIAERCNVELPLGKYFFPRLPTAVGRSSEEILREMAFRFMEDRLTPILRHKPEDTHETLRKTYFDRLDFELKVIQKMGFSDYFLIVSDFINWAKDQDIPVGPGRGSAAGSIAAYALRITDIDPVEHNLLFERFLNPERVSMPDIDVDFCEARRDEVINYVRDRYKIDEGPSVAQIITFGKLKAKAVLRDVARTMDFPTSEGDRLSKLIPNVLNITLEQAIQQEPRLEEEIKKNKAIADVFDIAKRLEGLNRHASIHAAGVVISDGRPLFDHVPLYKGANGEVVTQFDMKGVETIGLIKFDFLGLKNLTLIKDCLRLIKETRGEVIDLAAIPLDDKPAYDLLCEADTLGVFQLESSGMRQLITRLRPSCFEDVVALVALYRPGPLKSGMADSFIRRKHGEEEIDYPFECLKPILESTYGVCIYQEQVMQIANVLCSYSLGEADLLRRAMGKKDANEMAKQRNRFLQGAETNHHDVEEASKLFTSIEKFAEYGFNRSHSAAYGYIAYQTAWLKAHYRQEYMAALLTADAGNSDKILLYMNDCRTHEVMILPPNVNLSEKSFSVKDGAIVFGLSGVKNVGEAAIDTILQARSQGRPFENLCDFVERIGPKSLNRRVYESLIKCGAFDHFKVPRAIIESSLDKLLEYAQFFQKEKESPQISLFGSVDTASTRPVLPDGPEWPEKERLSHEKEALGFYITGHPLSRYQSDLSRFTSTTIAELADQQNASEQSIAGIISARRDTMTKKGDRMSILTLEDLTGSVEVSVFPRVYAQAVSLLDQDVPLLIRGEVEIDENNVRFKSSEIRSLLEARVQKMKEIHIRITVSDLSENRVSEMKKLFDEYTGNCSTYLHIRIPRRSKTVVFLEDIRLSPSEGLVEQLERLFGAGPVYFR